VFIEKNEKTIQSSIKFIQKENQNDIIFNSINYYIVNHNNSKNLNIIAIFQ